MGPRNFRSSGLHLRCGYLSPSTAVPGGGAVLDRQRAPAVTASPVPALTAPTVELVASGRLSVGTKPRILEARHIRRTGRLANS
jgi:hypothetical protein